MTSWRRLLRGAGLLAAAMALPCCTTDIGKGDSVSLVTIRISEGPQGEQGFGHSNGGSFSPDGRFFAFASEADNLTPDDANGFRDILVKDRLTGQIDNITNIDTNGTSMRVETSGTPQISEDGRYVAFISLGNFDAGASPPATLIARPFLFDRVTRKFSGIRNGTIPFLNDHTYGMSLSADGRYLGFATNSTNTGFATSGRVQVYQCDFGVDRNQCIITLVSHRAVSLTQPGTADCNLWPGGMSGDAEIIAYESSGSDIVAGETDTQSDIYLWHRSTGSITLASVSTMGTTNGNMMAGISRDGTTVGYITNTPILFPAPNYLRCERLVIATGQRQTLSDPSQSTPGSTPVMLSGDGTRVIYGVGNLGIQQQFIWIQGIGNQQLTQSTTGRTTTLNCFAPAISADGRWAAWTCTANVFVPNDTNGSSDVFIRGPF